MTESTTGERPTFAQAFASEGTATESPTVTPGPETTPAASASAETTPPPATDGQPPDHASTKDGPIPLERHKQILDGIYKERDEARQHLEEWKQYEWAKSVKREDLDAMSAWYQRAHANPVEFALQLVDELSGNAQHAAAMRSHAARLLRAAREGQAESEAPIEPGIPAYDDKGQLVGRTYTDAQIQTLLTREIDKRLNPVTQELQSRKQAEQQAEQQRQYQAYVSQESARIKTAVQKLPKATEHWDAIVAKARTYPEDVPVGEALRDAYYEVVFPTLKDSAKSEVLDTLKTKAHAGSVNPAGAVVATTTKPKSLLDPSLTW